MSFQTDSSIQKKTESKPKWRGVSWTSSKQRKLIWKNAAIVLNKLATRVSVLCFPLLCAFCVCCYCFDLKKSIQWYARLFPKQNHSIDLMTCFWLVPSLFSYLISCPPSSPFYIVSCGNNVLPLLTLLHFSCNNHRQDHQDPQTCHIERRL